MPRAGARCTHSCLPTPTVIHDTTNRLNGGQGKLTRRRRPRLFLFLLVLPTTWGSDDPTQHSITSMYASHLMHTLLFIFYFNFKHTRIAFTRPSTFISHFLPPRPPCPVTRHKVGSTSSAYHSNSIYHSPLSEPHGIRHHSGLLLLIHPCLPSHPSLPPSLPPSLAGPSP